MKSMCLGHITTTTQQEETTGVNDTAQHLLTCSF